MQQAELLEMLQPILQPAAQRKRATDYAAAVLLIIVLAVWGSNSWRNGLVPKIESLALVPDSVVIIGPADSVALSGRLEFCPGDPFTVRYQLAFEGEGTIYADDTAHYRNQTVKFSTLWRDYAKPGTRIYENLWVIPPQPDTAIDGERQWVAGIYVRTISVAASNIYISRYVPPATFEVPFRIAEEDDCL